MEYFEDAESVEYFSGKSYFIHTLDFQGLSDQAAEFWDGEEEDDSKALEWEEKVKANDPAALKELRDKWDEGDYSYSGTVVLYRSGSCLVVQDHSADWYEDHDTLPVGIDVNSLARALKALDLAAILS